MTNDEPAFPVESHNQVYSGMTLRDWFAGQALKGMCPNPEIGETWESLAADAYDAADAMLKERAK